MCVACYGLSTGLLSDLMHGPGHSGHIAWGEGDHGDAAIFSHEDSKVCLQPGHLLLSHPRVAEHANLLRNVGPISSGAYMETTVVIHVVTIKDDHHHTDIHI